MAGFHWGERWESPEDDPWFVPQWLCHFTSNPAIQLARVIQLLRSAHPEDEDGRQEALLGLFVLHAVEYDAKHQMRSLRSLATALLEESRRRDWPQREGSEDDPTVSNWAFDSPGLRRPGGAIKMP